MTGNKYPSKLLKDAVEAIGSLPGVGSRSALRLALHLLGQPSENIHHFTSAIDRLADEVKYCRVCNMISDDETCSICSDARRDHTQICVVESVRDVMSIEDTGQYHGVYHVLGGIISPINGIAPSDLAIPALLERYGGQISYMGGINNSRIDTERYSQEEADAYVLELCRACGTHNFIPCLTQGGPKSVYPGVYDGVSESIRRASAALF